MIPVPVVRCMKSLFCVWQLSSCGFMHGWRISLDLAALCSDLDQSCACAGCYVDLTGWYY